MAWSTFFPTFARRCEGLPGWFEAPFCLFDRGGEGLKLFGQCPYRTNTFQKGVLEIIKKGSGYLWWSGCSSGQGVRIGRGGQKVGMMVSSRHGGSR